MRTRWGTNYPGVTPAHWTYNADRVRRCAVPTGDFVISSTEDPNRFLTVDERTHYLTLSRTPKTWNVIKSDIIYVLKSGSNHMVNPKLQLRYEPLLGRNDLGLWAFYDSEIHHGEDGSVCYSVTIMEQTSGRYIRSDGNHNVYSGYRKEAMGDGKRHRHRWYFREVSRQGTPTGNTRPVGLPKDAKGKRQTVDDRQ